MRNIFILVLFNYILIACNPEHKMVKQALELAGPNRHELEKVLVHYSKYPGDSLKLKAARFLITNMPGHYAYDSSSLNKYRPILTVYDSLIRYSEIHTSYNIKSQMDSLWSILKYSAPLDQCIYMKPVEEDIKLITFTFLINNIEQAFRAWNNNPRRDKINFEVFCEYILPYRRHDGLCLEDWRSLFNNHFKQLEKYYQYDIQKMADSILFQFRDIIHTTNIMTDYPYFKVTDLMTSKRGLCEARCWFNSMLFSSLGIPISIDYIPAWGNRDSNHSWNVLITENGAVPFEPFWDNQRWKYKRIYNNTVEDIWWGSFRLPKVYRYSYSSHFEGPAIDKRMNINDIPPFFRNLKQKDVSDEYFSTSTFTIKIERPIPDDSYYLWLCVFNSGRWKPVQWGKIKGEMANFMKIGRDIIYLPAFYQSGTIIPAGDAFLLTQNGEIKKLKPSLVKDSVLLKRKFPDNPTMIYRVNTLIGSKVQGANSPDFKNLTTIFEVKKTPEYFMNKKKITDNESYRYIRFLFPKINKTGEIGISIPEEESRRLSEFVINENYNGKSEEIKGEIMFSSHFDITEATKCFDNDLLTYSLPKSQNNKGNTCWIGLDLKSPKKISEIGFCPQNDKNNIFSGLNYELFYWNDQWISLGIKTAESNTLCYTQVPGNAIFLLRCIDEGKEERIFLYDKNNQIWR